MRKRGADASERWKGKSSARRQWRRVERDFPCANHPPTPPHPAPYPISSGGGSTLRLLLESGEKGHWGKKNRPNGGGGASSGQSVGLGPAGGGRPLGGCCWCHQLAKGTSKCGERGGGEVVLGVKWLVWGGGGDLGRVAPTSEGPAGAATGRGGSQVPHFTDGKVRGGHKAPELGPHTVGPLPPGSVPVSPAWCHPPPAR